MLRLISGSAAALAVSVPLKVHAAEMEPDQKSGEATQTTKYRPSELPIYGDPPGVEYELIPEGETSFKRGVTSVRKGLWSFMDMFHISKDTTDAAKDKLGVAQAHSSDLLRYIREDAGIVPKAIIITVAGLGGLVAGYRGRYVKKGIYASIGMISAASICWPHQAVDISRNGWYKFKRDVLKMKQKEIDTTLKKEQTSEDQTTTSKAGETTALKSATAEPQKDYGQSKPEDKDMYTTRGS